MNRILDRGEAALMIAGQLSCDLDCAFDFLERGGQGAGRPPRVLSEPPTWIASELAEWVRRHGPRIERKEASE